MATLQDKLTGYDYGEITQRCSDVQQNTVKSNLKAQWETLFTVI